MYQLVIDFEKIWHKWKQIENSDLENLIILV
jgi:hypothetical protein